MRITTASSGVAPMADARSRNRRAAGDSELDVASGATLQTCSPSDREPLAACGEDARRRASGQDALHRGGDGVDDVFGVVEHDQHVERTDLGQHLGGGTSVGGQTECGDDDVGDGRRVLDRCELDEACAELVAIARSAGHLERETGLADAARAGERDQTGVLEQCDDDIDVVVAPDE